jgi:hypothetical protein
VTAGFALGQVERNSRPESKASRGRSNLALPSPQSAKDSRIVSRWHRDSGTQFRDIPADHPISGGPVRLALISLPLSFPREPLDPLIRVSTGRRIRVITSSLTTPDEHGSCTWMKGGR